VTNAANPVTLTFTSGSLTSATSSGINVSMGTVTTLGVETAADGSGTAVSAQSVTSGNAITVYAITRDTYGNSANPSSHLVSDGRHWRRGQR